MHQRLREENPLQGTQMIQRGNPSKSKTSQTEYAHRTLPRHTPGRVIQPKGKKKKKEKGRKKTSNLELDPTQTPPTIDKKSKNPMENHLREREKTLAWCCGPSTI